MLEIVIAMHALMPGKVIKEMMMLDLRLDKDEREPPQVRTRNKQPKLRVIKEYMGNLDSCLDNYTEAVARYCTVLTEDNQKEAYEDHMLTWVDHCEELKDRARDVIDLMEAAEAGTTARTEQVQTGSKDNATNNAEDPSHVVSSSEQTHLTAASLAEALSSVQVPSSSGPQDSTAVISSGMGSEPFIPMPGGSFQGESNQISISLSSGGQLPPIMSTCARGATTVQT